MLTFIGLFCVFGAVYAYFGYPLALLFLKKVMPFKARDVGQPPSGVSIVITCRNEEKVIAEKLENTLSLVFGGSTIGDCLRSSQGNVQVIVASDASDDQTHQIVEGFADRGVELVKMLERKGKELTQKMALNSVRHDVVVFTDAKVFIESEGVEKMIAHFADSSVGAVSSRDRVIDAQGRSGEGAYVKYEMWIRNLETAIFSVVGLSGSCFAVRKSITGNFPENVPSDFCMLIEARKHGLRGIHSDEVIAEYRAVASDQAEFERKVRTVVRGMRSVWIYRKDLFQLDDKFLLFQILSHKLFRWLVPFFVIGAFLSSLFLCLSSAFWFLVFISTLALFVLALIGYVSPEVRDVSVVKLCFFFVLTNFGIFMAWIRFLSGDSQVTWNPSAKG